MKRQIFLQQHIFNMCLLTILSSFLFLFLFYSFCLLSIILYFSFFSFSFSLSLNLSFILSISLSSFLSYTLLSFISSSHDYFCVPASLLSVCSGNQMGAVIFSHLVRYKTDILLTIRYLWPLSTWPF